jgi:small subunit ribosomal protein S20
VPIIKSAKKRVRVSEKATIRNAKTRRSLREAVKAFQKAVAGGKQTEIAESHKTAVSAIDTAAKKNVIHKNKAARKKSQLSAAAKAAGAKPVTTTKKAATKKVATPKPAVKKPAAKKATPAKKPAVKK